MDMITVSAKTLDEAITKALLELQTTSDHLHYEVVQKESSGLFGLFGAKQCVIRAKVMTESEELAVKKAAEKEAAEKKKADRKEAEKKLSAEKSISEKAEAEKTISERAAVEKKEAEKAEIQNVQTADNVNKPEDMRSQTRSARLDRQIVAETDGTSETAGKNPEKREFEKKESDRRNFDRRRSERRDGTRRDRPERSERPFRRNDFRAEVKEEQRPVKEEKPRQPVKADPDKVQKTAKEFLVQVFGAMGMEVSVTTEINLKEGELLIMMEGTDMGLLIGKRGQTLDSLQYLVSLVVNKETEGYLRVKLDTENYRERRKETLETLARNISYKVKRTKKPVSLEPMNPYERRIIHSALQNDRYVITRSEGEDPYRHVVISLKNDRGNSGRRERYPRRDRERFYGRQEEKTDMNVISKSIGEEKPQVSVPVQEESQDSAE